MSEDTSSSSKRSLQFSVELPSPQSATFENISPIKSLNPYQNKWTIKGRVTHKRSINPYSTATKNGHVFSFDIVDTKGCEVRVTCFDEIAELHSDRVEVGSHYVISKGSIKEANTRYNKLNSYLEIIMSGASILKCCGHEEVPNQEHSPFILISEVFQVTNNTLVDIIGVVVHVGDIIPIHRKDGTQTQKRVVRINDLSGSPIDINLWGPTSHQRGLELKNMLTSDSVLILVVRNARVGYFNGKVVNVIAATTLHINPPFLEAEPLILRGNLPLHTPYFSAAITHINGKYTRMTISSIRERMSVKPETIETTLLVVLRFVNVTNKTLYYIACPLKVNEKPCKKKCTQQVDDSWFCPRCEMTMAECNYSYLLPMKLQNVTGTIWATTFDEVGTQLINKIAKELCALQNDTITTQTPCSMINKLVSHRYSFTLLVSTNTCNSESKMKVTINKIYFVDYKSECDALLVEIACLSTQA
ncbi:replication protein A 70 kDa DNA-binding subunit A-like [Cryptomeria japonica]|uniref:replication protein A 70 kDa DNA-binding subunit A-like n=1 Tax=Cryptomeria japonica TaxID=3369 RepID=UPI0027D9FD7C|nr:replication protein A 70 kDa DNA-binding subunit A-like [Cryptomeria japonica]